MGKTALIVAPLIVAGFLLWFACVLGIQMGRRREAALRNGIDPRWAGDAVVLLRRLLVTPTGSTPPEDFVVLPTEVRSAAQRLLDASPGAGVSRAQNPRSGW